MSEPVDDLVPPTLPTPTDRLDVESTAGQAVDLDAAAEDTRDPSDAPDAPAAPGGRHRGQEPEALTRAQRRVQSEATSSRRVLAAAEHSSVLDHPAVLVGLSVLTLVALVAGLDQASQGRIVALLPAVLLGAAYVVVVRRRRSHERRE